MIISASFFLTTDVSALARAIETFEAATQAAVKTPLPSAQMSPHSEWISVKGKKYRAAVWRVPDLVWAAYKQQLRKPLPLKKVNKRRLQKARGLLAYRLRRKWF